MRMPPPDPYSVLAKQARYQARLARKATERRNELIIALAEAGFSRREIAQIVQMSHTTISKMLKRHYAEKPTPS